MSRVDRSTDIRQPKEADRVHVDKQRGRDGCNDDVHDCRDPAADGRTDHSLCRPRHRPAAGHLTRTRVDRDQRDDAYAA